MMCTLLYKHRILVSAHSKILLWFQALIDSRVIRSYKKIVPQELFYSYSIQIVASFVIATIHTYISSISPHAK